MARRQVSETEKERFAAERREQLERWQVEIADKVSALVDGQEWQRWLVGHRRVPAGRQQPTAATSRSRGALGR